MRWHPPEHAEPDGTEWYGGTAREENEWQAEQITVRRLKHGFGFRPQKAKGKRKKGRRR